MEKCQMMKHVGGVKMTSDGENEAQKGQLISMSSYASKFENLKTIQ